MAAPRGTFAKNDTISSTSEVSGIRMRPLKNMWIAKPHSAVKFWSQSVHSRSALSTTPPSSIQLVIPKNAQAIAPACTTTSTAIMYARKR